MTHSEHGSSAGRSGNDGQAPAWVVLPPDTVPARWRSRARHVVLVQLLAEEAATVLDGAPAVPALDERDERLARMVVTGASLAEMARAVGLSRRGVGHRLARLRERFGVSTTAELIAQLVGHGFPAASSGNAAPQEDGTPHTNSPSDPEGMARR